MMEFLRLKIGQTNCLLATVKLNLHSFILEIISNVTNSNLHQHQFIQLKELELHVQVF